MVHLHEEAKEGNEELMPEKFCEVLSDCVIGVVRSRWEGIQVEDLCKSFIHGHGRITDVRLRNCFCQLREFNDHLCRSFKRLDQLFIEFAAGIPWCDQGNSLCHLRHIISDTRSLILAV